MSSPIPSRQALQHLARLCRMIESPSTKTHLPLQHLSRIHLPSSSRPSHHIRRPNTCRPFSSTPTRNVQPSPSVETDPQNTATAVLPDITNYYTLFPQTLPSGPPGPNPREQSPADDRTSTAAFTIHLPTLRQEFLRLQSQHHPDKYQTSSSAHQKALALSSLINNAYKTLSDPLARAQYLLQMQHDIDVTSEDNSAHPTDQATLLEVMEAQERIEDAKTQDEIDEIKDENERRMVETVRVMGEAFENGDAMAAKDECVRLKYWRSLQDALKDWEPGKDVRLIH